MNRFDCNSVNSLLTARKENVEHMTTIGSGTQPQLSQDPLFGYPAVVNALPSSVQQSGVDLANQNISLWTSVTSAILLFIYLFNVLKTKIYKINLCRTPWLNGC